MTPPPSWDPYTGGAPAPQVSPAVPVTPAPGLAVPEQPPALFPEGIPWKSQPGYYGFTQPDGTVTQLRRFLSEVRFESEWLAGPADADGLQINSGDLSATFAIPFLYNTETPLLVTPGFAITLLNGPGVPAVMGSPDLPPRVYDAYLDLAWKPHLTPWLSGDIGGRADAATDFKSFNSHTIRWMGRGLGVLTFTPNFQLALGAIYLDRVDIKLLPAGGVVWTPTPDMRFDILFPNPKAAKRLRDIGTTEIWCYVAGEYGGGSWNVDRPVNDFNDEFDYNDIRVLAGLEFTRPSGCRGHFEVGYVFNRELFFDSQIPPPYKLDPTYMLRGGVSY